MGKWGGAYFQELFWGYGQEPVRVACSSGVVVLLAALWYQRFGHIVVDPVRNLGLRDYVNYSVASFALSSIPDLQAKSVETQLVTSLEGIAGVVCLTFFITALANRMGAR